MSEEDMLQVAAAPDEFAPALLHRELDLDDTNKRLSAESTLQEAENLLRASGRAVPGERVGEGGSRSAERVGREDLRERGCYSMMFTLLGCY